MDNYNEIKKEKLVNINLYDSFFDSFRNDYFEFDKWFLKKADDQKEAYIYLEDGSIKAFLLLKEENVNELDFELMTEKNKVLKVSSFKVDDKDKGFGTKFMDLIFDEAKTKNIDVIYATVFSKYDQLIRFFEKYGLQHYTSKETQIGNGNIEKEEVYMINLKLK